MRMFTLALPLLTAAAMASAAGTTPLLPNGGPDALAEALSAPLATGPFTTRAKLAVFQSAFAFGGTVRSKNVTSVSRIATGVYCVVPAIEVDLTAIYPQLTTEWTLSSGSSGLAYWRNTRTLALVGPAAAGKTSLAEACCSGRRDRVPGTLERGTTVSDFDPLERRMQHSLNASVMHLHAWQPHPPDRHPRGARFHRPEPAGAGGGGDRRHRHQRRHRHRADGLRMMAATPPSAISTGSSSSTRSTPRGRPGRLLAQIQATFGKECLPLNLPDAGATQVVDCFFNREGHCDFGSVEPRTVRWWSRWWRSTAPSSTAT
jgi:hypothetical protein